MALLGRNNGSGKGVNAHGSHSSGGQTRSGAMFNALSEDSATVPAAGEAAQYSASNYGNGGSKTHKGAGKKKHRWVRIVLLILLALVVAAGVAVAAYVHTLDQKLGFDDTSSAELVQGALTPAAENEPFYVLLLGSDSREYSTSSDSKGVSEGESRSDVMMLVRVDPANRKITLVSIPRDTRWYNSDSGKVQKINSAYNNGPAASIKAVEQLTGVKIAHYAQINIDGFESLVDAVGGIYVYVPKKIGYKDALTKEYVELQKGWQTLNGQQAQIFARVRHDFKNGDGARQQHNQEIIEALISSIQNQPVQNMPNIGLAIADCLDTDFNSAALLPLAREFLSGDITIYNGAGPIDGDTYVDDKTWYCYPNDAGWKKLINTVEAGKNPKKLKYTTPQLAIDQAHGTVDCDTVHDPATATDLSGDTAKAAEEFAASYASSSSSDSYTTQDSGDVSAETTDATGDTWSSSAESVTDAGTVSTDATDAGTATTGATDAGTVSTDASAS